LKPLTLKIKKDTDSDRHACFISTQSTEQTMIATLVTNLMLKRLEFKQHSNFVELIAGDNPLAVIN
jgi:hypothetical protein